MASSVFDLFARLLLDTSEFEKGLNGAKGIASGAGSKIGSAISTGVKVAGAALAATTTAVTAFGKSALDASINYETAFTGVTKTVEETTSTSYEMLSNAIKQMSTETASSKEVIAGVMEAAGQLGVSADDIVGFTKTMIELGDTTNLSANEAAIALAHFTNITRTSNGDVDKLGAAIVDLGNNFATDEASIVSMSTRLAASGTIAGLTAPDILALATAMSSVGIEAEAGGTAMSTVLTKIGNAVDNGGEKLEAFARVAGMTSEEFTTAWKSDPVEALSSFIVGLNNTMESGGNVSAVLEDLNIKGIRETNMVKSLALAHDVLNEAVNTSNTAFQENSALTEEAEKRYGTTESRISQLKEAFSNLKIVIGDELLPTVGSFVDGAKEKIIGLTTALQDGGLSGALEKIHNVFGRILEAISPLTEKITELTSDEEAATAVTDLLKGAFDLFIDALHLGAEALAFVLDKGAQFLEWLNSGSIGAEALKTVIVALIGGFAAFEIITTVIGWVKAVTTAFTLLHTVLLANPIGLVVAAIAALVAGFIYLWNTSEDFRNFWIDLWDKVSSWAKEKIEEIKFAFEVLKAAWGLVKDWFKEKAENIKGIFTDIKNAFGLVAQWFDEKIANIKEGWNELVEWLREKGEEIGEIFTSIKMAFGLVRDWFYDKINDIKDKWEELKDDIHEKGEAIKDEWTEIKDSFVAAWETVKGFFTEDIPNTFNDVIEFLAALPQKALEWGTELLTQFGKGIEEKVEDIIQAGRDIVTNVKDGFVESASDALNWGRDLISNFIDGIKNGWSDLKGTLGEFADKIADFLGFSEPKEGPLSNFHTYAPDMMKLFAKGIKDNEGLVTAQISRSFNFEPQLRGASPALAAGPTTNTYNITVNGIEELEKVVRWYQGRQVEGRMK